MEDLAVVYSLGAGDKVGMITNEDLKKMGITEDQLRHAAMEQAPKSHQLTIKTIEEALGIPDSTELESQKLFVASTADAFLGAGVIAYPGFMEKAAEITGGDFYVLKRRWKIQVSRKTRWRDMKSCSLFTATSRISLIRTYTRIRTRTVKECREIL